MLNMYTEKKFNFDKLFNNNFFFRVLLQAIMPYYIGLFMQGKLTFNDFAELTKKKEFFWA